VSSFVSDVQLREEHVRFDSLSESETAEDLTAGGGAHLLRPSPIQVVIVGINGGDADAPKLDDLVLSEMCQMESVSWGLCGKQVSVSWVIRDLEPPVRHPSPSPCPSPEYAHILNPPLNMHTS
jgi:hypothetical protein